MKNELYRLKKDLQTSFQEIKNNPMDLNRLMSHLATMSKALSIVMDDQIGSDYLVDEHFEMLQKAPAGHEKIFVRNIAPWVKLKRTVKAGNECDLSKVPPHKLHFWSDTHFEHKKVIEYCDRPFRSLDDMSEALVARYNDVVQDDDVVVWCGDISFTNDSKTNAWLRRFKGYKILVVGNHDIDRDGKLKKLEFDEIHTSIVFDNFVVTHHPWTDNLPDGMWNIHGHTHNREFEAERHLCVCVEKVNYTPITFADLTFRHM